MVKPRASIDELSTEELLRRGVAAARVGEVDEARSCLTEVTARAPENADAWLWLASVESNPQQKRDHFERVLALRPDDAEARDGLERLTAKYGEGLMARDEGLESLRCSWHPDRETMLRCARCGRPMCPECARQHPVGMRCKECMHALRSPLYRVSPAQYAGGFLFGLGLSFLAAIGMGLLSGIWWFLALFAAVGVGAAVGEAVSRGSGRKRGRGLQIATALSMVLGSLLAIAFMASPLSDALPLIGALRFSPIGPLILLVLGSGAAVRQLR